MVTSAPLTTRSDDQPIAFIMHPTPALSGRTGSVSVSEFLADVAQLAASLPDASFAINLCQNRYLFLVSMCAVLVRGQTNLLPPNTNQTTQEQLHHSYTDSYVIHDGVDCAGGVPAFNFEQYRLLGSSKTGAVPHINNDHQALISFTSGSTGESKPNIKSWGMIVAGDQINRQYMLHEEQQTSYQLATVPAQHMWGMETTIMLALFNNVCVADTRPFFPQDIAEQLQRLPEPRVLVTTPVHLRALIASKLDYPEVVRILCATSPLTDEMAVQAEAMFVGRLREIYGCSEVGSMAWRDTATSDCWQRFAGIEFIADGTEQVLVSANHVSETVVLQDRIELLPERQFKLRGRLSDLVNIAGKRGSLQEINQVLLRYPGLIDGVVFFPPQDRAVPRLVALVVLPADTDRDDVVGYFRKHLDAAFVPRPVIVVDKLPRESNGKLSQQRLLEFYRAL